MIGTLVALAFGINWVFAKDKWQNIDPQDPGKLLVLNVVQSVRPQSVRPQLEYVVQQRTAVFVRVRKLLEQPTTEVAPAETEQ